MREGRIASRDEAEMQIQRFPLRMMGSVKGEIREAE